MRSMLFLNCRQARASRLSAWGLCLLLAACASQPAVPTATPSPAAPGETPAAPVAAAAPKTRTPFTAPAAHLVPIDRIDSTQQVQLETVQRCGPRITRSLPPPSTFERMASWVGLGGPSAGEVPAPEFQTEEVCTPVVVRRYAPARFSATYHQGAEAHTVDVPTPPGRTLQVDDTGQPLSAQPPASP